MSEPCKFEDKIMEIHGDIKTLVTEFKNMNGKLIDTKIRFDKHETDSVPFRHQITVVWAVLNTIKWSIILLFGTGIIWNVFEFVINKP